MSGSCTRSFSALATDPVWRETAEAWAGASVAGAGLELTGRIRQTRVRPWSTQLAVPTDAGPVWFKANVSSMAFEPAVQMTLAQLLPDLVDEPFAIDRTRGWMLTRDRGATWGDANEPTAAEWCRVAELIAAMQQRLVPHRRPLLAAGLPDFSPEEAAGRFGRLVEVFAELPEHHPSHVDAELRARLEAAKPKVVRAAQVLSEGTLPTTWQHGDAHPWNVFAIDDGFRIFDFGDGYWAHALEVLSVPRGLNAHRRDIDWADVERAYCAAWGVNAEDIAEELAAARTIQPVHRAITWWRCLSDATAQEWDRWGGAPRYHLSGVLDSDT